MRRVVFTLTRANNNLICRAEHVNLVKVGAGLILTGFDGSKLDRPNPAIKSALNQIVAKLTTVILHQQST